MVQVGRVSLNKQLFFLALSKSFLKTIRRIGNLALCIIVIIKSVEKHISFKGKYEEDLNNICILQNNKINENTLSNADRHIYTIFKTHA